MIPYITGSRNNTGIDTDQEGEREEKVLVT
jgi:hypothetical protein